MRGEGIGQTQHRGELRAEQAGAKHPHFDRRAGSGDRGDRHPGFATEIGAQLGHVLREIFRGAGDILAHGVGDAPVRPRRAAQPQIDAPREQRVQRAELFCDYERVVIWQHYPARADTDGRGSMSDMRQHDCGRPAADPVHAVMLGDPEPLVALLLGALCQ